MKKLGFLIAGLFIVSCVGEQAAKASDVYKARGREAIEYCLKHYEDLSRSVLSNDADRAYVLMTQSKLDVLFTKGEVGTFGPRSPAYKAVLGCGVLVHEEMQIYFLGAPLEDPLIKIEGEEQITDSIYNEDIWDLLYIKVGSGFEFRSSQKSNPRNTAIESDEKAENPDSE